MPPRKHPYGEERNLPLADKENKGHVSTILEKLRPHGTTRRSFPSLGEQPEINKEPASQWGLDSAPLSPGNDLHSATGEGQMAGRGGWGREGKFRVPSGNERSYSRMTQPGKALFSTPPGSNFPCWLASPRRNFSVRLPSPPVPGGNIFRCEGPPWNELYRKTTQRGAPVCSRRVNMERR